MQPVRTALFAPGSKERVMAKALESGADAVIFDLEDSVALAAKPEARGLVGKAIEAGGPARPAVYVRVNAVAAGMLAQDIEAAVRPGLDAILLPKPETADHVQAADRLIGEWEDRRGMPAGSVAIMLMIESALGVRNCYDLIKASARVGATCFAGARDGDLQTDLGCGWSVEGTELLYARSKVLLDTRAAGSDIHPLDGVFSDLADEAALIADTRLSARLGFVGRTVIHPKQIAPVKAAYAVPETEVAYYKRVVEEFTAAEKAGVGAIAVEGKLVDYAMAARARRVLALAALDEGR